MWLHNTETSELHYFSTAEDVPGGYTILSHVWDQRGEQTFQEVQAIWVEYRKATVSRDVLHRNESPPSSPPHNGNENADTGLTTSSLSLPGTPPLPNHPRELICAKIHDFLAISRTYGYEWAWCDTSCINKESSTELSEAINSMYRYYALSDVCFVYLADLEPEDVQDGFRKCKWHTRGWTLQELLAPKLVVFLDREWTTLGTKTDLAGALTRIVMIPERVLRCEQDISEISVAARMSWASARNTTRLEDEAYCLMGIFGINMPTLYGEGRNAFYRLQEEIMKRSSDSSLFVWGNIGLYPHNLKDHIIPEVPTDESHLFAWSPSCFTRSQNTVFDIAVTAKVLPDSSSVEGMPIDSPLIPTFSITPHGVLAYAPIAEYAGRMLLILPCSTIPFGHIENGPFERPVSLPLFSYADSATTSAMPSTYSLYYIDTSTFGNRVACLWSLSSAHSGVSSPIEPRWRRIYISSRSEFRADPSPPLVLPLTRLASGHSPFRISSAVCRKLTYSTAPSSDGPDGTLRLHAVSGSILADKQSIFQSSAGSMRITMKLLLPHWCPPDDPDTLDEPKSWHVGAPLPRWKQVYSPASEDVVRTTYVTVILAGWCARTPGKGAKNGAQHRLSSAHWARVIFHPSPWVDDGTQLSNAPQPDYGLNAVDDDLQLHTFPSWRRQVEETSREECDVVAWPALSKTFNYKHHRQDPRMIYVDLSFMRCPLRPRQTLVLKDLRVRVGMEEKKSNDGN